MKIVIYFMDTQLIVNVIRCLFPPNWCFMCFFIEDNFVCLHPLTVCVKLFLIHISVIIFVCQSVLYYRCISCYFSIYVFAINIHGQLTRNSACMILH
ncbi:unnamed protein product [Acanthoscelides obtectus]|uniref:Uncharacterized protein n=1 Tax=Acanthoscelides obtectus TaxID=200917 RepID=A0A9P0LJM2_ACAOB|nr:unnamed protein product [Acanthoscelides obtectus]CAK1649085.1 hypothetical protein AOBTE_LOCUS16028 [Acanthoscelides obtectus]